MDLSSPSAIAKLLLPKVPLMLSTTVAHSLWLSQTSSQWDLRTELLVTLIRSIMTTGKPTSVSKAQRASIKDPGIKGRMWISKVTLPAPAAADDVVATLQRAFDAVKEGSENLLLPKALPVEAEWTGYRAGVDKNAPELKASEEDKYGHLMKEVKNESTVLYFHGGVYYLMDPATHRAATSHLAKLCGGRVLSVRYRLAPQDGFPAQLLDALIAYLSLLYPPTGSLHSAVSASKIVFAGDSAGGGLSLALLQLILALHHASPSSPTVTFHGQSVALPIPGGIACSSPWSDVTCSSPSYHRNTKYDYLPPPSESSIPTYPDDDIWPPRNAPARMTLYADDSCLYHPFVSPITAPSWAGAPPILLLSGEELLGDEAEFLARQIATTNSSGTVVYQQYKAMPHCFVMMLTHTPESKKAFTAWGDFIRDCTSGAEGPADASDGPRKGLTSRASIIAAKTVQEQEVELADLAKGQGTVEDVRARMKEAVRRRLEGKKKKMEAKL